MKVDPTDKQRRPFRQIADDLRRQISDGKISPGAPLPSIANLAETYGVAGATIQNALRVLKEENIVESVPTRGFYVRDLSQPEGAVGQADLTELAEVRSELRDLQERVTELEGDNADLRAVIMDLYGRMGQPYPHETAKGPARRERTG
jgi:DNA-binding transcriptional regulator YhcF (GntR family)